MTNSIVKQRMKMTKISGYIYTAVIILAALTNNSYAQTFYDINTIQTISITFSQSNWDYMLDTAKAGSDGYIMAQSVTINGTQYDTVGVKYKGIALIVLNRLRILFTLNWILIRIRITKVIQI